MPEITIDQSIQECETLSAAIDTAPDDDGALEAIHACLAHPCAYHWLDLSQIWVDLAAIHQRAGRYDESIAAWESAMAAGFRGRPHPRANVAELLVQAGRREAGDALFAELKAECGDDVWLFNSAGWVYAKVDDHETAVRWLEEGIELALAGDNDENVLIQLRDMYQRSCDALDRLADSELLARVEAFRKPVGKISATSMTYGTEPPVPGPCAHCGWSVDTEKELLARKHINSGPVSPFGAANQFGQLDPGVVPIDIDELFGAVKWGDGAELLEHNAPPAPVERTKVGRNEPCPCGSGRKYKQCHGA